MFFKNARVFRVQSKKPITLEVMAEAMEAEQIPPAMKTESVVTGWVPPRDKGALIEMIGKQFLIALGYEKKLLPSSVVNQFVKAKVEEITEQQGFKPGRKQIKDIKENVTDELMPRAFSVTSKTIVWIDLLNGWIVVNSASQVKQDDVLTLILKSMPFLTIGSLHVKHSPTTSMTHWLESGDAPYGFTVDTDTEMRSNGDNVQKVRYVNHTPEIADVVRQVASGKQCTALSMTWKDRISFSLTESLIIKKITPLDILKESDEVLNDIERFNADFTLMSGELNGLLCDLTESLGGFQEEKNAA